MSLMEYDTDDPNVMVDGVLWTADMIREMEEDFCETKKRAMRLCNSAKEISSFVNNHEFLISRGWSKDECGYYFKENTENTHTCTSALIEEMMNDVGSLLSVANSYE